MNPGPSWKHVFWLSFQPSVDLTLPPHLENCSDGVPRHSRMLVGMKGHNFVRTSGEWIEWKL